MNTKRLSVLQTFFTILLAVGLVSCSSAAVPEGDRPAATFPAVQNGETQPLTVAPSVKGATEPTYPGAPNLANDNPVLAFGQELEPITVRNIQRLGMLARFGEGGLEEELAISPDGELLALAASGGVVLYSADTGQWLDFYPTYSNVKSLAFSPDGQKLAYLNGIPSGEIYNDATELSGWEISKPQLTMRSILTGEILYEVPLFGQGCGEYSASDIGFTEDGQNLMFRDTFSFLGLPSANSICVLNAGDGSLARKIELEEPWRLSGIARLTSDGKSLWASSTLDSHSPTGGDPVNQLRRYNLEDGSLEVQFSLQISKNESPNGSNLCLSPDGRWLAFGPHPLQVLSAVDGSLAVEIESAQGESFSAASFAPDGSTLALGEWDGSVNLYSIPSGQLITRLEAIDQTTTLEVNEPLHVLDLVFSADGSVLYTLMNSNFVDMPELVRAMRMPDGQEIFRISGRNTVDRRPSLSLDHALLAWGGYEDGSVQVWSTVDKKRRYILIGHTATVLQTLFSPDGSQLATASMDGTVRLWHTADGRPQATFEAHQGGVWSIGYTDDGSRLASVGRDGLLKLWNPADGSLLKTLETDTSKWQVNSLCFTADQQSVLVVSGCLYPLNCLAAGAGGLREIDLTSGQITNLLSFGIQDLSFSLDRSWFSADGQHGCLVGQVSSGQFEVSYSFSSPLGTGVLGGSTISPDGSLFLSGNASGIHAWDVTSGQMIALVQDRSAAGNYGTIQFTPDGRIVIISGADGVIYLWGVRSP